MILQIKVAGIVTGNAAVKPSEFYVLFTIFFTLKNILGACFSQGFGLEINEFWLSDSINY
jgi:hypothetical protein